MKASQYHQETNDLIDERLSGKCDFVIMRHQRYFNGTSALEFHFTERTNNRIKLLMGDSAPTLCYVTSKSMPKIWSHMPLGWIKEDITVFDINQMLFMLNVMSQYNINIFDYINKCRLAHEELFQILNIATADEHSESIINEYYSLQKNLQWLYVNS